MQSHFNTFTQEKEEEEEPWVSGFHRVPSWVTTAEPGDVGFDPAAFCMPTQGSKHILSGHASCKTWYLDSPHLRGSKSKSVWGEMYADTNVNIKTSTLLILFP